MTPRQQLVDHIVLEIVTWHSRCDREGVKPAETLNQLFVSSTSLVPAFAQAELDRLDGGSMRTWRRFKNEVLRKAASELRSYGLSFKA